MSRASATIPIHETAVAHGFGLLLRERDETIARLGMKILDHEDKLADVLHELERVRRICRRAGIEYRTGVTS